MEEKEVKARLTPVSILRWLAWAAALVGVLCAIFTGIAVEDGDAEDIIIAVCYMLLYTTLFSGLLYGFSCLVSLLTKK